MFGFVFLLDLLWACCRRRCCYNSVLDIVEGVGESEAGYEHQQRRHVAFALMRKSKKRELKAFCGLLLDSYYDLDGRGKCSEVVRPFRRIPRTTTTTSWSPMRRAELAGSSRRVHRVLDYYF